MPEMMLSFVHQICLFINFEQSKLLNMVIPNIEGGIRGKDFGL